jgi:hypothetical protein
MNPHARGPHGSSVSIKLSPTSIVNAQTDLFWLGTWGVEEGLAPTSIVRTIDPPVAKAPGVEMGVRPFHGPPGVYVAAQLASTGSNRSALGAALHPKYITDCAIARGHDACVT